MYHTLLIRRFRLDLVIDIFLCKDLKSAKVLETATRSEKHETIVEAERLRTIHIMERTCLCMSARVHFYIYSDLESGCA